MRLFFWYQIKKHIPDNAQVDPEAITYGKHLTLNTVVASVSDQIDSVLLFNLLGPIQLATFQFAIAPIETGKGILKHIQALALPKFSARKR
jgi:O-antigen/teichoic acid export membrane protein